MTVYSQGLLPSKKHGILANSSIFALRFYIMVTKHKILDDFYDEWFALIALHSSMEDHLMAFALNSALKTRFKRSKLDIEISADISFPVFEWIDEKADSNWMLFSNTSIASARVMGDQEGLFKDAPAFVQHYLIPERKEVDYFIKVDQEIENEVIREIQKIPKIMTAYMIDCETLSSKNNLIF